MMNFGRKHFYALDDDMNLNEAGLASFLEAHGSRPFLIFGFTFMVWQYLLQRIAGRGLDFSNAILVHSGGWKKLEEMAVSNPEFRRRFAAEAGLIRIYNFYGMAEQVGSVFLEGDDGYLYPPNFADVIVRDPLTFREQPIGEPRRYPGTQPSAGKLSWPFTILTEDMGVIRDIDDSNCGRAGKYFSVIGRVPRAELRGCSDVHASQVA